MTWCCDSCGQNIYQQEKELWSGRIQLIMTDLIYI